MGWLRQSKGESRGLFFSKETEYYYVRISSGGSMFHNILKKDLDKFLANINKDNVDFFELTTDEGKLVINKDEIIDLEYKQLYDTKIIFPDKDNDEKSIKTKYKRLGYELVDE